uniref:Uncharacterized protein n=1 Tax=Arundo donax TaxID=35708 RepID=A0A0A9G337_ARUDO
MIPYTNPRALHTSISLSMYLRIPSCALDIFLRRAWSDIGFGLDFSSSACCSASLCCRSLILLSLTLSFHIRRASSSASISSSLTSFSVRFWMPSTSKSDESPSSVASIASCSIRTTLR